MASTGLEKREKDGEFFGMLLLPTDIYLQEVSQIDKSFRFGFAYKLTMKKHMKSECHTISG